MRIPEKFNDCNFFLIRDRFGVFTPVITPCRENPPHLGKYESVMTRAELETMPDRPFDWLSDEQSPPDQRRKIVAEKFAFHKTFNGGVALTNFQLSHRIRALEDQVKTLFKAARLTPPELEESDEAEPEVPAEPMPVLDIGSTAPRSDPDYSLEQGPQEHPKSDRRHGLTVRTTHQVTNQWKSLFGVHNAATGVDASDHDIRRRILGVFHTGGVSVQGSLMEVRGINRYSMEGVLLKCVIQGNIVYISSAEKVSLTEI